MKRILLIMLLLAGVGLLTQVGDLLEPYKKDLSVEEAHALMDRDGIVWLDVRETGELATVPKLSIAHHVPLSDFAVHFAPLNLPLDTPIFVVCRSGNRSKRVQDALQNVGYTAVSNISGGMTDWYRTFPLKKMIKSPKQGNLL